MKKLKVINGEAASSGVAIGRAAVIKHAGDISKVEDGTIIISRKSSPKLAIILSRAKAVVTENGGQTANVMGLVREYGIPAVVGIPGLTETIRDGDIVRVDGIKGTVNIQECMAA